MTTPQEALQQAILALKPDASLAPAGMRDAYIVGFAKAIELAAALSQQESQELQPILYVDPLLVRIAKEAAKTGKTGFMHGMAYQQPEGDATFPLYAVTPAKPADSLEQILADLRTRRDATTGEIRSAYNAVCDRLDVLVSHLSAKPAEQEEANCDLCDGAGKVEHGMTCPHCDGAEQQAPSTAAQERLLMAAKKYRDNYLLDEIDEPELCISKEQHDLLLEFSAAIDAAIAHKGAQKGEKENG